VGERGLPCRRERWGAAPTPRQLMFNRRPERSRTARRHVAASTRKGSALNCTPFSRGSHVTSPGGPLNLSERLGGKAPITIDG